MQRILITGSTGLIGGEVVVELAATGHEVVALARAASPEAARSRVLERLHKSERFRPAMLPRISALAGDTCAAGFALDRRHLEGVRAIIHCAADTSFLELARVRDTNVAGARNLVELARCVPGARVLFISTASVVTAPSGKCVDEREPYAGYANTYTRSKREAELIVESSGLDMVIVRPSIVLSRGVRDAAMARSILWAVPMMGALGEIPVDARARVDLVPVDFTARAIARLATAPSLRHRRYHVSSGGTACTFEELLEAVRPASPVTRRIRPAGSRFRPVSRKRAPLLRALELYFPFINADVRYSNERLLSELGGRGLPPAAVTYLPELVRRIGMWEARTEMALP